VPVLMVLKAVIIYGACRAFGSSHNTSIQIAGLLPQGGEFGFVIFSTAAAAGIFDQSTASLLVAIVTISMALTPLAAVLAKRMMQEASTDQMDEDFEGAGSDVLMVGFSRFGQIASQILLAGGSDVTIIDQSADRIRSASKFGFKIYFGDGTRKDVLAGRRNPARQDCRRLHAQERDHRQDRRHDPGRFSERQDICARL
jgi:CPA2 family monovalent cation:H+ antiporter-2